MNELNFTFMDTIGGYVTAFDPTADTFTIKTSDGREYTVKLTNTTNAQMVRNLDEPYQDCTGTIRTMLVPGRMLHVYGAYFPEETVKFEAKSIIFQGRTATDYRFEKQGWWIDQINSLGKWHMKAQFDGGEVDYSKYRTMLSLGGGKVNSLRQETDTISRLVYGLASAYMLTGDENYLKAAEDGTLYLRQHMRFVDRDEDIVYWYHGIDVKPDGTEQKIFASEFGDDYQAIPAYEQIYALAGPTQTYRITGDPKIMDDANATIRLFEKFFLDKEKGGYFSHLDPITLDPRAESLGQNRAKKNWNSVGDHAPAYLINLWLGSGDPHHAKFLEETFDTIAQYFPDFGCSPFVQEKFMEDWSHDKTWGWQQNRGVVGHNLKISWNLMRMYSLKPKERYLEVAQMIAQKMPTAGMDAQRGGWYDVVERILEPSQKFHRFVWHDRKAWWQQEQGILAYWILAGILKNPEYLRYARESSAFYNAYFLDHDDGAVYFNVLANGLPYLLGTERYKGSHSMCNYHTSELCYLAAIYTNLLVTKQPMDFYFKPVVNGFKDGIIRVSPDILPPGSIIITKVEADGLPYTDFDAKALTVKVPASDKRIKFKVTISPV